MAKSQVTFNKIEKEKKRLKKREEKQREGEREWERLCPVSSRAVVCKWQSLPR